MFEPLEVTRVVATPAAIDTLRVPDGALVLRTSPDEAMVVGAHHRSVEVTDPDAIVVDDAGWHGTWLDADAALRVLERGATWSPAPGRPALAQGMLLQLPVKLWVENDRTLFITAHTVAEDLAARMDAVL